MNVLKKVYVPGIEPRTLQNMMIYHFSAQFLHQEEDNVKFYVTFIKKLCFIYTILGAWKPFFISEKTNL